MYIGMKNVKQYAFFISLGSSRQTDHTMQFSVSIIFVILFKTGVGIGQLVW
jgi:hypothetical protein